MLGIYDKQNRGSTCPYKVRSPCEGGGRGEGDRPVKRYGLKALRVAKENKAGNREDLQQALNVAVGPSLLKGWDTG